MIKEEIAIELIKKQGEYIELLVAELSDTAVVTSIHGWRSKRYRDGKRLRGEMKLLLRDLKK